MPFVIKRKKEKIDRVHATEWHFGLENLDETK
jgi:hypothetical protein